MLLIRDDNKEVFNYTDLVNNMKVCQNFTQFLESVYYALIYILFLRVHVVTSVLFDLSRQKLFDSS